MHAFSYYSKYDDKNLNNSRLYLSKVEPLLSMEWLEHAFYSLHNKNIFSMCRLKRKCCKDQSCSVEKPSKKVYVLTRIRE